MSADIEVLSGIQTVIYRSVAIDFVSFAFQSVVESAVQKYLAEPLEFNDVDARTMEAETVRVPVAKSANIEVEKHSLK